MAALGVAVLIIAVIAFRHPGHRASARASYPSTTHAPPTAASSRAVPRTAVSTPPAPTSSTAPAVPTLPLVILNNTSAPGLAEKAQASFQAGGWTVTSTGNLVNDIISTCAYYDPAVSGALAAATRLRAQFPAIKRVKPKFADLPPGPIVVVLTSDYTSG